MELESDFCNDLKKIFIEEILEVTSQFKQRGNLNDKSYLEQKNFSDLAVIYFNFKAKFPELKKRKVVILDSRENSSLYAENIDKINKIKAKFENGDNFYPYLSKGVLNDEKEHHRKYEINGEKQDTKIDLDVMLYTARIHHLHINDEIDINSSFAKRGKLLFCVILKETVYFLDIKEHISGDESWCNEMQDNLLQMIHDNMNNHCDLKESFKLIFPNSFPLVERDEGFSSEEKFTLNRIGGSVFYHLKNGASVLSHKMISSDGTIGIDDASQINRLLEKLRKKEVIRTIEKSIYKIKKRFYSKCTLVIIRKDSKWILTDPLKQIDLGEIKSHENDYGVYFYQPYFY